MRAFQTIFTLLLFSWATMLLAAPIAVTSISGDVPVDPLAESWQKAPTQDVIILPQQMAMPALATASVDKLTVQALSDGKNIAWRVTWADATADFNVDTQRFSDAVALEFPLGENAAPMMGHKGAKVQILYWKGLWQKDQDVGFQDVQDLYPNYWSDLYWFADGEHPYRIPEDFQNPAAQQWFIAKQAGNPMSMFSRSQPAEELVAEGWGTLTHQDNSVTLSKGVWQNGQWQVVFARPLTTDDPNDHQFKDKGQVAFALWLGDKGNVGGKKHWSSWVEYQLQ